MKKTVLGIAVLTWLMLAAAPIADAQTAADAQKQADVRKLLALTGAAKMGQQMMDTLMERFQALMPQVPQAFWTEFRKEARPEDLEELIVPIYAKHLSDDDIQQAIRFYQSPAGQRFVQAQPAILEEAEQVGEQWGQNVAHKVVDELKAKGYDVNGGAGSPEPAPSKKAP